MATTTVFESEWVCEFQEISHHLKNKHWQCACRCYHYCHQLVSPIILVQPYRHNHAPKYDSP